MSDYVKSAVKITAKGHPDLYHYLSPFNKKSRAEEIRSLARIGLLARQQNLISAAAPSAVKSPLPLQGQTHANGQKVSQNGQIFEVDLDFTGSSLA